MGKDTKYFGGLINIISLKKLFKDFSQITGLCIGIYEYPDFKKTLVASEFTNTCRHFFRANKESLNHCSFNHQEMIETILANKTATFCKECPFGFMTSSSPIFIDGECIAVLVVGQASIKRHSDEEIEKYANTYGFDLKKFKEEISKVRVITKEEFTNIQNYLMHLAEMISEMGTIHKRVSEKEAKLKNQNIELIELKEELSFTKYSIDDSPVPIMWIDKSSIIIDMNNSSSSYLGYSKNELIGKSIFNIEKSYKKEQWPKIQKKIQTKDYIKLEGIHQKKNGILVPVEIMSRYQKLKGKEFYICFIKDVTEKKVLQEQLADEKRNLEQTVITRTMELQHSLEALKKANNLKSQFISSVSHELRTPLNAIIGFADILDKEYYGNLNEKQIEYVELISNSGRHLLQLINEILDMSRLDSGETSLIMETINYTTFISEIRNLFKDQFKKKMVSLKFYNPDYIKTIYADRKKLKQIIINLLSNALKFTDEDGEATLTIQKIDSEDLMFTISDTGMGIKEDDLENIFIDFYQTQDVRMKALGGTGIGLALTRRLVELHNGEIGAESDYGEGSTFWFTLPIKKKAGQIKLAKKAIKA